MPSHEVLDFGQLEPFGDGTKRYWLFATIADYPGWVVNVEIMAQSNSVAVAELRVYPLPPTAPSEMHQLRLSRAVRRSWPYARRAETLDDVPSVGVPSRLMRRINVGELHDLARGRVAAGFGAVPGWHHARLSPALAGRLAAVARAGGGLATAERPRPGRRGNGIDHYLAWAVRYDEKVSAGVRRPIAELAAEHGETSTYVRDTITDARRRYGLLKQPGQGRAGGGLTPKAIALLKARED